MAGRSSMRTYLWRSLCGTCGRRSRARRSRSSHRRPHLRSIGGYSRPCAAAGSPSPPLTHAAGISSTGDDELDKRLPFDEPYVIPLATAAAIRRVRARGGRVVAIGTTVVRALEHGRRATAGCKRARDWRRSESGRRSGLRIVDAILSGIHEPGTSHYELLRAFTDDATLGRACDEMTARDYRTHEFGDSVLIERNACRVLSVV